MPLKRDNRKSRKCYRKSRKDSRKNSRKNSRRNSRRNSRKNSRRNSRKDRRQNGGGAMLQSLAQGQQFASIHKAQHGGAMLTGAPLSAISDSMLPGDLRSFARIGGLDASIADAAQMRDPDQVQMPAQKGGRRGKASRKNKDSRKNKKASRKNKKNSRKQYGGAMGAPYNQPTMLLSASEAAKAGTADFSNPLLKH